LNAKNAKNGYINNSNGKKQAKSLKNLISEATFSDFVLNAI
jgi:hypothetical protein